MTAVVTSKAAARKEDGSAIISPIMALTALGVVYGDLGTSPLYSLDAVMDALAGQITPSVALGILSLVFWALIITISVKYCVFVMCADNNGEGGILALMSLLDGNWRGQGRMLVLMGLFGAALIYGDGIITPAISVLSALEGLNLVTSVLRPHIMPVAVALLLILFAVQSSGTSRIGKVSGPIMLVWFGVIALLGIRGIVSYPAVLKGLHPGYALNFLAARRWAGLAVLGGVFLAITGGEALYADMGHIGSKPIRISWFVIVLPALLLNYAGQAALLCAPRATHYNLFYSLAPNWAVVPLVVLATAATIIASQAIITGAFSLTRQATQLGWFPNLLIRQTSAEKYGQIYVPFINWMMMVCTLTLTIGFGTSERLAGAYGTAVSTTMLLTTALLYHLMRRRWGWPMPLALITAGSFIVVDTIFFAANLLKIRDGGWVPLVLGALFFAVMIVWRLGVETLAHRLALASPAPAEFVDRLQQEQVARMPGTGVYLTRIDRGTPVLMIEQVRQLGSLHQQLVVLTVKFETVPWVDWARRLEIDQEAPGFWRVIVRYGFVEVPNLPLVLSQAGQHGCHIDVERATYLGARYEIVCAAGRRWRWWVRLFDFLFRNCSRADALFNLPSARYLEIGRQIEI